MPARIAAFLGFGLLIAAPARADAQAFAIRRGFSPDPFVVSGIAGGPANANQLGSSCRGNIPVAPQHTFVANTGFGFLRVFAASDSGDLTLVVRGPNGIFCADDTFGLNPGVDLNGLPPGQYQVFVGSYRDGDRPAYRLAVSQQPGITPDSLPAVGVPTPGPVVQPYPGPGPVVGPGPGPRPGRMGVSLGPLQPTMRPQFGRTVIRGPLRAPRRLRGRGGGTVQISGALRGATGTCRGFVTPQPSYQIELTQPYPFLRFFATSAADTVMVIQRPDGSVECQDDSYGFHPAIEGSFEPGTYNIWVGTYRPGMNNIYMLSITADPSMRPGG